MTRLTEPTLTEFFLKHSTRVDNIFIRLRLNETILCTDGIDGHEFHNYHSNYAVFTTFILNDISIII